MDKILEQSLLYDFYGELLTKHQRQVYEDYVFNDIGISEIAEEQGISRQGVHDLVKRCNKILSDYETKLGLVNRFECIKKNVASIDKSADLLMADDSISETNKNHIASIKEMALEITSKLI
jgi:predicted DNA-binding protein YlxM (UPF0122 family)